MTLAYQQNRRGNRHYREFDVYPRTAYQLSDSDFEALISAIHPVPCIVVGGMAPRSQQENANSAWASLGERMGFDWNTVRPIYGKGDRWFSAVPTEPESVGAERLKREKAERDAAEAVKVEGQIAELQAKLSALRP